MKKHLSFLFTLLFPLVLFSQNDKVEYSGGLLKLVAFDYTTKEILIDVALGKEVLVKYDPYYKSYYIVSTTEDGNSTFNLKYIQKTQDGRLRYMDERTSGTTKYLVVIDNIKTEGILMLIDEEIKNMDGGVKGISTFVISNLKQ